MITAKGSMVIPDGSASAPASGGGITSAARGAFGRRGLSFLGRCAAFGCRGGPVVCNDVCVVRLCACGGVIWASILCIY